VVVALNLIDEARRHRLQIDERRLARDLGALVVPMAARQGEGVPELLQAISEVASGETLDKPYRVKYDSPALKKAVSHLTNQIKGAYPDLPNARWVALRLLDGDERIAEALQKGELGNLTHGQLEQRSQQLQVIGNQ
jgi:GTPase